jgi:NAD+ kinase
MNARPNRPRVLVIYKKSAYRVYVRERRHPRVTALIKAGDRAASRLMRAHDSHEATLLGAREALRALGALAVFRHRSIRGPTNTFDLVVTIGGDGTLLRSSQLVGADVPVVAINSAPDDSIGFFCAGNRRDVADVLAAALHGQLRETDLTRMKVVLDGELVTSRVLNDVLFCHVSPAGTARYAIRHRGREEEHKSSGIWVATPAGSTAAISSAGGRAMPVSSGQLQFRVREPYRHARVPPHMLSGFVRPGERLVLRSQIRSGRLFMDGPRVFKAVEIGAAIELSRSREPLTLLGFTRPKR